MGEHMAALDALTRGIGSDAAIVVEAVIGVGVSILAAPRATAVREALPAPQGSTCTVDAERRHVVILEPRPTA